MSDESTLTVEVEDVGPCSKKVRITVPSERVDREIEDTFNNVQKAVHFRGFRPGKAPRRLVEARMGERVLDDVKERLIQTATQEAIEGEKLETLGEAEADWEGITVTRGEALAFEVTVDVRPDFDVPDLSTVSVTKPVLTIDDTDVDAEIEKLRMQRATSEDAGDDPLAEAGIATLDVKIECEGETIVDESDVEWTHPSDVLGGMLIEGMAAGLLGKKKDETGEFTVPLPDNFRVDELRGKDASVLLTVTGVQRVNVPALDDEFAAELDYDDVDELRGDVQKQLERELETHSERALDNAIIESLLTTIEFDLPPSLVRRETGRMLARFQTQLQQDGTPEDTIREELAKAQAEAETRVQRDLRSSFILDRIASDKKVFATENEVRQEIARMASSYDRSPAEMEEYMQRQGMVAALRVSIRERKTVTELRSLVTLTESESQTETEQEVDA